MSEPEKSYQPITLKRFSEPNISDHSVRSIVSILGDSNIYVGFADDRMVWIRGIPRTCGS